MQYRTIPRSGVKLSCISFGGMRIPTGRGVPEEQAVATVRRAIDLGVNYLETAPGYGNSEILIGKALKDGYRERTYVSTKSHVSKSPDVAGLYRSLEESMRRLDVDYVDFYHMWYVCTKEEWRAVMKKGGELDGAKKAQAEGLIGHIGITTHAPLPVVREMVTCGEYELVTISYNAGERKYEKIIDLAGENDVGVVIMNPLGGGTLAKPPRGAKNARRPRPHIMAALGFLLAKANITTAACGARSPEEMEEDAAAGDFLPSQAAAAAAGTDFKWGETDFCTTCGYCMPCTHGVDIPQAMLNWNYLKLHDLDFAAWTKKARAELRKNAGLAKCIQCGECTEKCPNSIGIIERLEELERVLDEADNT